MKTRMVLIAVAMVAAPLLSPISQAKDKDEGEPVALKGANGSVRTFAGVKESTPGGLVLRVRPKDDEILVRWELLDLEDMEARHPEIYKAAEQSIGELRTVPVMRGLYATAETYEQSLQKLMAMFHQEHKLHMHNWKLQRAAKAESIPEDSRYIVTTGNLLGALAIDDENDRKEMGRIFHGVMTRGRNEHTLNKIIRQLEEYQKGLPSPLYDHKDLNALSYPQQLRNAQQALEEIRNSPVINVQRSESLKKFYDRMQIEFQRMMITLPDGETETDGN